jgi:hypothetical protein
VSVRYGVKSRNLINATKEANGIILLKLGETETRKNGEKKGSGNQDIK